MCRYFVQDRLAKTFTKSFAQKMGGFIVRFVRIVSRHMSLLCRMKKSICLASINSIDASFSTVFLVYFHSIVVFSLLYYHPQNTKPTRFFFFWTISSIHHTPIHWMWLNLMRTHKCVTKLQRRKEENSHNTSQNYVFVWKKQQKPVMCQRKNRLP